MNVTVDSLRNLAANQSIMFNTKRESIEKAKAYHSIGVHFGTAASKARNQATLQAIKQAIVSDPRYANVRTQARDMLDEVRTDMKINSSQIQSILKKLDGLSTPEGQLKLLKEKFTVHLANRTMPPEWEGKVHCVKDFFHKKIDSLVKDAESQLPSNLDISTAIEVVCKTVNVSMEIEVLRLLLVDISNACRNEAGELDADAFEFMSGMLAKCPSAVDTPEKVAEISARLRNEAGELDADAIEFMSAILDKRPAKIDTLEKATAMMDELRPVLTELRGLNAGPDTVKFGVRHMSHIQKPAKQGVFTALNDAARKLLPNAQNAIPAIGAGGSNPVTGLDNLLSGFFNALEGKIDFPEGADPNDAYEKLANVNFIFRQMAVSLPRDIQKSLLDALDSPEGRNLRLCYEDMGDGHAINGLRAYDAFVETLSNVLDRPVDFLDTENLSCDIAKIPSEVRTQFRPFDPKLHNICDIARSLSPEEGKRLDNIAIALKELGNKPDAVANQLARPDSVVSRMLAYPALTGSVDMAKKALPLFLKFDAAFAQSGITPKCRWAVERFVFDEIAERARNGKELPALDEFQKSLTVDSPYFDFAKWGFDAAETARSLLAMPVRYRQPTIAAMKAFCCSTDIYLFNRIVAHRDAIMGLHQNGNLTLESAYREITGDNPPFAQDTPPTSIRNHFGIDISNKASEYVSRHAENNPNIADHLPPVYVLTKKYDISVEDAFRVAANPSHVMADDLILNPFAPAAFQRIDEDVNSALDSLARDLHRMVNGYSVNGTRANVPPGSVFNFTYPDGSQETITSRADGLQGTDLANYQSGKISSVTESIRQFVSRLCGPVHPAQIEAGLLGLGQGCLAPLREMAAIHGVGADEHSQVKIDLRKDEEGNVHLRVSQPENCPLEFNWTLTITPNGTQSVSEIFMRRANNGQPVE